MTDNNQQEPLNPPTPADGGPSPGTAVVTEEIKSASPPATSSSGGKGLASFALLLALGAAGGSGYLWYQWEQDKQSQEARLKEAFDEVVAQRAADFTGLQEKLQAHQSKTEELANKTQALSDQDNLHQKDAQSLRGGITSLQNEIKSLQGDITTIKGEVEIHKGGVDIQKTDTQNLIAHVRSLQTDIQNLQDESQALKTAMETEKGDTQITKTATKALQDQTQALTGNLQALQDKLAEAVRERKKNLADIDNRIQNVQLAQRNLLTTLDNVKAVAGGGGDLNAFTLSEVEYLLHLAEDKLKLQQDIKSALETLQIAKARLATVEETAFANIRNMLDDNIASLKGAILSVPDRSALAHKIVEMEQRLPNLPLRTDVQLAELKEKVRPKLAESDAANANENWLEQFGDVAWKQFKDIVTIRRERSSGPPLVAIEEEFFLYQNLRLELEAMRMSLLAGDATSFEDAAKIANDWMETYFDTSNEAVSAFLAELKTLRSIKFNPYVPDIANTLRAFLEVMERRQPILSTNAPAAGTDMSGEAAQ
ncbi:MAG: uroporphyrinogen-III C-methyltransferase [Candidatus Competibacteraceae bacterium]|jgi:uroporphyrin-3 C-methyltransferase|nr:uroporphyrinogen-III C-methyltransferase [Candidatus Competibacteraceae bacterium]